MKKIYLILLSILIVPLSYGQIITEDFNFADGALLTANGWTAHSGATSNSIDVGTSNGLTYAGYSGTAGFTGATIGNAVKLDNTGEDINKAFSAPVTSGDLYVSFLVNVTAAVDGYFLSLGTGNTTFYSRFYAKPSATTGKINFGIGNTSATYSTTDFDPNTTYLAVIKYNVSTTGALSLWIISSGIPAEEAVAGTPTATSTGSGNASVAGVYLRQYSANQNITIDGLRIYTTWFNTSPCALVLTAETKTCDAITLNVDTYNVTIPFTGGGTATYSLSATSGSIGGDNPSTTATGNITISGISETNNTTLTVTGGCSIVKPISAPECKITNALPVSEPFNYNAGTTLNTSQMWTNTSTANDEITTVSGSLSYTGIASTDNSVSFAGTGSDTRLPFTDTTSGQLYTSFLVSVTDLTGISTTGSTYFVALSNATNVFTVARIYFKTDGTLYQYGISPTVNTTDIVWSTNTYAVGTTQYLVLSYNFSSNALALIENPTIGGSTSAAISVTPTTALTSLANFILRQDSATTTPNMKIDELKISSTPNFTLSSSSFDNINSLILYPNPLSGNTLYLTSSTNGAMAVQIYDLLGKEVLKADVVNNSVNVAKLTAGIYVVKITEAGKTATRKVVIK